MQARRPPGGAVAGLGRYGLFALPLAAVVMAFYCVPLIGVLALSVTDPAPGFGNYVRLFTAVGPSRVFATTLEICAITTLISVVFGYATAYGLVAAGDRLRIVLLAAVLMPFWVSALIRAFSWMILLQGNGIVNQALIGIGIVPEPLPLLRNQLGVVIGMVHYLTPYAVLPLYAAFRQIDMRVVAAARSLGASERRTFFTILLPITLPGVLAAVLIVFVFSLGFFVTPALLGGGRVVMLSEYVSVNVLQTLRWGFAAAQAAVLLALTLVAVGVLTRLGGVGRGLA
ncbi:ABC transporter permease [Mongoliimonas terrestris]|uniref:ABC transporter permease n=1 Tax=Mongoliimonas terrestris TaxID=1709001 RepID=UPI001AED1106|nr:ABC transporter permease [Mongoliimonas terrestris]